MVFDGGVAPGAPLTQDWTIPTVAEYPLPPNHQTAGWPRNGNFSGCRISPAATMTDLQVVRWPVEKLIPYARNARTHSGTASGAL